MFNNMKNKIREKTGTEIPKFVPNSKLSVTSSRQGSETSLNSLSCPITDVNSNSGAIIQKTSDFREIDESSYNEWLKKEEEFQKILTEKENEWRKKEQNYLDQMEVKQKELAETMKQVEDSRNKIIRYQEDKDQLEQYQLQEMSKIKHLLLTKEKENCENAAALKESLALVENLKHEVTRLRPLEEQISNYEDDIECLRHSSERERWTLSSKLAQSEESVRHLRDRVEVLMKRTEVKESGGGSVEESIAALREERSLLEQRLEEAHIHLSDIKSSWSGKISSLETQVERLSRQAGEEGAERRKADNLIAQLEKKLKDFEANNESLALQLTRLKTERDALATELKTLTAETSSTESETNTKYAEVVKELEDLKAKLEDSEIQSNFTNEQLKIDVQSLMQSLEHEKLKVRELEESLTEERRQRDEAFLRNAEMSQQMQIAQSDLRTAQQNNDELLVKLNASEQAAQSRTSPNESETNTKYAEVVKELEDLKAKLEDSEIQNNFTNEQLKIDVQSLMQSLEHEKLKVRELEQSLTKEKEQRDDVTLRNAEMTRQIAIFAESVKELQDLKAKLEDSEIQSNFTNEQLKIDVQSLMQSLEHEKLKIRELEESLTEERRQRDEAFLRNAEMSQQMQIAQSDLRTAQQDNDELLVKLNASEQAAQSRTSDLDLLKLELNELRSQVGGSKLSDVENELNEKNKTVRMLQQRLSDLKKTLQQELRNNSAESRNHTNQSQNHSNESQNHTSQSRNHSNESKNNTSGEDTPPAQLVGSSGSSTSLEDDVNFKYLKHVIIKFLTCRDYEAQHLTRAVAVLLRLSAEEEQSLKDTLDTRGSWWSSRPRILPR